MRWQTQTEAIGSNSIRPALNVFRDNHWIFNDLKKNKKKQLMIEFYFWKGTGKLKS